MKLRYVGPFDEVDVPALGVAVVRNGTVEATGEVAENLLAQGDNFKRATDPKPRKPRGKKAAAAAPDQVKE